MSLEWRCRIAAQVASLGGEARPMPAEPSERLGAAIARGGYPGMFEAMARREIDRDPKVLA